MTLFHKDVVWSKQTQGEGSTKGRRPDKLRDLHKVRSLKLETFTEQRPCMGRGPTRGKGTIGNGKGSSQGWGAAESPILLCCLSVPWCSEKRCLAHNYEVMFLYLHPMEPQGSFTQMAPVDQCRGLHLHHFCLLPVPCSSEAKVFTLAFWLFFFCGINCFTALPFQPLSFLCVLVSSRGFPSNPRLDFSSSPTKSVLKRQLMYQHGEYAEGVL